MPESPSGAVGDDSAVSCVEEYSPAAVNGRGFAFDGTVVEVGPGTTDRPGKGRLNYAGVTFAVETWFVGGSGPTVSVDMAAPESGWETGTRLLVSGESRYGEGVMEDGIAWMCGFTRYHDEDTAAAWAAATD
ncbi:hypothetical protein GCM10025786_13440 [Nocardioides caeni]